MKENLLNLFDQDLIQHYKSNRGGKGEKSAFGKGLFVKALFQLYVESLVQKLISSQFCFSIYLNERFV